MSDRYLAYSQAGWRGKVREDWSGDFTSVDPLDHLASQAHEAVRDRPSSRVWRVTTPRGSVYVKHQTAADDTSSRFSLATLRWLLRPARALRMLWVTRKLRGMGFLVPPVILAARRRGLFSAEDLIVSEAIEGDTLKEAMRQCHTVEAVAALAAMTGRRLAQFHQAHFVHGDPLPGNLLVTPDRDNLIYIDNDRTSWTLGPWRGYHQWRNVAALLFRLWMSQGGTVMHAFLDAYCDARGFSDARRRRWTYAAFTRVRARRAKRFARGMAASDFD